MPSLSIIGRGRVGWSLHDALARTDGPWTVSTPIGRTEDRSHLVSVDLVMIAVPDRAIADVARSIPVGAVVGHLSGATTLDALAPHERAGSAHPLMTIPNRDTGSARLLDGCPFAVEGHPLVGELVDALGGQRFAVDPHRRTLYHAAAVVASNHVVAVLAQAERLFDQLGLDRRLLHGLTVAAIADVAEIGARDGLTGPAARGDWSTVAAHLSALEPDEIPLYRALAHAASELGEQRWPHDLRFGS